MPRDFTKPFTEEELEEAKAIFRTMPTYKEEGYILSKDIGLYIEAIAYERTPKQITTYIEYWDKNFGGMVPFDEMVNILSLLHHTPDLMCGRAAAFDKDGNGFISSDEFVELVQIIIIHDPRLEGVSFEEFVKKADTNHDGKVSIDECGIWIHDRFQNLGYTN